jgi:diguanylate cyclase (GGDEF)-like protein
MTQPARILVVDDHEPNRLRHCEWLRDIPGVECVHAASALAAFEQARAQDFALFLLDVNLPDLDGFELASLLREDPRSRFTPIVFVSGEASPRKYLTRSYRMGEVDFLLAASDGAPLVRTVPLFLEMFRQRQQLQEVVTRLQRQNPGLQRGLEAFIRERDALGILPTQDPLTRLPNRAMFRERLAGALARAARRGERLAVACVGLDDFPAMHDRLGAVAGDELLLQAADRLARSLRASDTVARLGRDEFALLLEGLEHPGDAGVVASKIHARLVEPYRLRLPPQRTEIEARIGASIGVSVYPVHARDAEDLLLLADLGMHAIKRNGGGVLVFPGAGRPLAPRGEPDPASDPAGG